MFLILLFVLMFGWFVARGINSSALSNIFKHSSEFEKQPVEMIAPVKQDLTSNEKTIHYVEYVALTRKKNREAQVQIITLTEIPEKENFKLYLN